VNCEICTSGATQPGRTTITLERGPTTLVFKEVPAQVCVNCGEAYVDQETTSELMRIAEEAVRAGVHVDVREFTAKAA
jgi:YgiT-type zinc finger domain-containing protein